MTLDKVIAPMIVIIGKGCLDFPWKSGELSTLGYAAASNADELLQPDA